MCDIHFVNETSHMNFEIKTKNPFLFEFKKKKHTHLKCDCSTMHREFFIIYSVSSIQFTKRLRCLLIFLYFQFKGFRAQI